VWLFLFRRKELSEPQQLSRVVLLLNSGVYGLLHRHSVDLHSQFVVKIIVNYKAVPTGTPAAQSSPLRGSSDF
jgi:hypothetical protein